MLRTFWLLFPLFLCSTTLSEVIEFPDEELAKESVLPVFDKVEVVKNRNVPTEGRFEFGGGLGLNLTEAIYDNKNFNVNVTYNFTNIHGVNFSGIFLFDGLSAMGEDLAAGKGLSGGRYDATLAPRPESYFNLNYQITTYYGKISLAKNFVINIALYGLLGTTFVQFTDTSSIGLNAGMGQKFYFNPNFALRFDLMLLGYKGPDPTTADSLNPNFVTAPVSSGSLDDTLYFRTLFNFGLVYLL